MQGVVFYLYGFFPIFGQLITTRLKIMWKLMFPFRGFVHVHFQNFEVSSINFLVPPIKLQCLIQYWDELISSWCESAHGEIWHPSESGRHQYEPEICSSKFEEINFTAQTYDSCMLCLQPWLLHNEERHIHMIWYMKEDWTESSLYGNVKMPCRNMCCTNWHAGSLCDMIACLTVSEQVSVWHIFSSMPKGSQI